MEIQSKNRIKRTPSILLPSLLLSLFIPFPLFKPIDEVPNFIFNLARIPLDEQNPERKKKPNNEEDAQENDYCNSNSKRKFFKDLFNIPFHSHPYLLLSIPP